ncbi:hypothetical protein, partial [Vibrio sp. RE86]|uniref:hypothetical protein n=1 Tax=Vibrio sp. RE86 TaxID=2607605 RepID=UPI001C115916
GVRFSESLMEPFLQVLFCILVLLSIGYVIYKLCTNPSEWKSFVDKYPVKNLTQIKTVFFVNFTPDGFWWFKSLGILSYGEEGIIIGAIPPFCFFYSKMFIPYSELNIERKPGILYEYAAVSFSSIVFRISLKHGKEIIRLKTLSQNET